MKRLSILASLAVIALSVSAGQKVRSVFTLDHQMRPNCEVKIKTNLRFHPGVSKIVTSRDDNTITITYDADKTNDSTLVTAFSDIGFNAMLVTPAQEVAPKKK